MSVERSALFGRTTPFSGPDKTIMLALVGQRETCLAAGMNGFLTKPIQPDALYAAITRWAYAASEPVSVSQDVSG